MAKIRLDKFLCDTGLGSRSQLKKLIKDGNVTVNQDMVDRPEFKVDTENDVVSLCGDIISYSKYRYYMFHKPAGCVTAVKDRECKTVMDYFPALFGEGYFPVGRLDKDTEGLLLITNDGEFSHNLTSPKKHVKKTYYARVMGKMTEDMISMFKEGIDIGDDKITLPSELEIIKSDDESEILLTITEGRYHQVKRMVKAAGGEVVYLKRLKIGGIGLDESLLPGEYRMLTGEELKTLKCI